MTNVTRRPIAAPQGLDVDSPAVAGNPPAVSIEPRADTSNPIAAGQPSMIADSGHTHGGCEKFAGSMMQMTTTGNMLSLTNPSTVSAPLSELFGLIRLEIQDRF
ncbi:hypothetical protein [Nocardia sp. NPDC051463]|uniref:hypothetical protein n=1 Tax=Nocardia sp. NPDC051463 TaxID=3154845 RepID=UPI00344D19B7